MTYDMMTLDDIARLDVRKNLYDDDLIMFHNNDVVRIIHLRKSDRFFSDGKRILDQRIIDMLKTVEALKCT